MVCRNFSLSMLKYSYFMAIIHRFSAKMIAQALVKEVPLHCILLKRSTIYHPQTHGQIEPVNQCLGVYLHCFYGQLKGVKKKLALQLKWGLTHDKPTFMVIPMIEDEGACEPICIQIQQFLEKHYDVMLESLSKVLSSCRVNHEIELQPRARTAKNVYTASRTSITAR